MIDNVIDFMAKKEDAITLAAFEKLCREMLEMKFALDDRQQAIDREKEKLMELQEKIIGHMTEYGKTKHHIEGLGTIRIDEKESVQTPKTMEDKQKFFAWLDARGMLWEVININSMTLNKIYNEESEKALQQGILDFRIDGIGAPKAYKKIGINKERK